jgi:hypothetical protein
MAPPDRNRRHDRGGRDPRRRRGAIVEGHGQLVTVDDGRASWRRRSARARGEITEANGSGVSVETEATGPEAESIGGIVS